jgi:hypothetical protein
MCPHAQGCELFPLFRQRSFLEIWKASYCESDFSRCSRFKLSCDASPVPITLLPNGKHLPLDPRRINR